METMKFKCCKKDFYNYICVVCLGLYHPSCMERKGSVMKLGKCKICCSEQCQKEYEGREEEKKTLHQRLEKVENDCKEKDMYILRLKRQSQDFEDEVVNVEGRYVRELVEQKNVIINLNKEIEGLQVRNEQWQREFDEREQSVVKLERDIVELSTINKEMISTIRTLEEGNRCLLNELERIKEKVSMETRSDEYREQAIEGDGCGRCDETSESRAQAGILNTVKVLNDAALYTKSEGKRLLILCDETARHLNGKIKGSLNSRSFQVESVMKPGAWFGSVISSWNVTKNCTSNDYILIMAGVNDFRGGKYPSFRALNEKIKAGANANVLIASVPYVTSYRINRRIYSFNMKLYEYSLRVGACRRGKVEFLDVNGSGGVKLSKDVIAKKVASIVNKSGSAGNLVFIDTDVVIEKRTGTLDRMPESPSVARDHEMSFLIPFQKSAEMT